MNPRGRPRKYNFEKGQRLFNRKYNKHTRWTYVKDLPSKYDKRRVLVACDCGSIEARYLNEILNGRSTGCRKCAERKWGTGIRPNSLRQASINVGKAEGYFSCMKRQYPERFQRLKKLGGGDIVIGWYKEQELKELGEES